MNPLDNQLEKLKSFKEEFTRFMLKYKFALREVETKVEILSEEFQFLHNYNPIEHTKSRVKSIESIFNKQIRKNGNFTPESITENIKDIAGIRITCSFKKDIYKISESLKNQQDLKILSVKDYIENPKENGYRSLHVLVEVPVFMSDRVEHVPVEIQLRTIAMDFWASLEHKIFYKYDQEVPAHLLKELKDAADSASRLDEKMEYLHHTIGEIKESQDMTVEDELTQLLRTYDAYPIQKLLLNFIEQNDE